MRRLHWKELLDLCKAEGCVLLREKGDHLILGKPGIRRPVVFPKKDGLGEDIVLGIARTLGLNRKQLESRLSRKNSAQN